MNPDSYGLIEMAIFFGVVIVFAVWQLVSLEKAKKKTREKNAAAKSKTEP